MQSRTSLWNARGRACSALLLVEEGTLVLGGPLASEAERLEKQRVNMVGVTVGRIPLGGVRVNMFQPNPRLVWDMLGRLLVVLNMLVSKGDNDVSGADGPA